MRTSPLPFTVLFLIYPQLVPSAGTGSVPEAAAYKEGCLPHITGNKEIALLQDQQMGHACSYSFFKVSSLQVPSNVEGVKRFQGEERRKYRDEQDIVLALKGFPTGGEILLS